MDEMSDCGRKLFPVMDWPTQEELDRWFPEARLVAFTGETQKVGRPVPEGFERRMHITPYSSNPVEYKATLSKWADKLEALDI